MADYFFTRYSVKGDYDTVLAALETQLETVANTKAIHLIKIIPRGNEFVGVLLYIT